MNIMENPTTFRVCSAKYIENLQREKGVWEPFKALRHIGDMMSVPIFYDCQHVCSPCGQNNA